MTTILTRAEAGDAPVDKPAKQALVASTVGYAMDGYDFLILAFMLGGLVVSIADELGDEPADSGHTGA